jgi:hypothetical protein
MSRSTDAQHIAAVGIDLDDHCLEEPRRLTGQSSTKRDPPHRPFLGFREHCLYAVRLKRHFPPRDLDGLLASNLESLLPSTR